ncbi:glycosyltransferase family 4 protein [Photobacterium sanguinicancri]|uniref:Glycosyltransferase family 4 protein n=1 Tax=Photobacterium sanguinicancri TaxID=875932 RepID=A0AAW7Y326_9GAMM|nr:glycosyltransferase family 4 protein [Photobacterium sanguinicancri]MDO6542475.1 glycosyltransferase family 4 protein [Photobacterium sanguinicancri]
MKILQVSTVGTTLNSFLLPFARAFKSEGWIVDAAASGIFDFDQVVSTHNRCFDVEFCRNPLNISKLLSSLRKIRKIIKKEKYDVVHVHTPIAAFLTRLASIGVKQTKVYYTAHGFHYVSSNPFWKNGIFYLTEKIAGLKTDHLFVINNDDYNFALKYNIVKRELISYIHGIGVDPERYQYLPNAREEVFDELELSENTIVILHVAELNKNKNHDVMLKALSMFKAKFPYCKVHYLIVGEGMKKHDLEVQIESLDLMEHVSLLGRRNDIPKLLSACDIVTLSSIREGLPRCILEAMCVKKPIIASNIRGCNDLLSTGAGILVNEKSSELWADAIESLCFSPKKRKLMGTVGRQLIDDKYSDDKIVDQVINVYKKDFKHD